MITAEAEFEPGSESKSASTGSQAMLLEELEDWQED